MQDSSNFEIGVRHHEPRIEIWEQTPYSAVEFGVCPQISAQREFGQRHRNSDPDFSRYCFT
jgi:hypothetical protein